jgi:hypothetical protein
MTQPFGTQLVAGDTWTWPVADVGYDLASWTVKYFLRGSGQKLDLTMEADGAGGFQLRAAATDTKKLTAGDYSWQLVVTNGTDRNELARGMVEILGDVEASGQDFDGRSFNKRMLDAIRAVMQNRGTRIETEYQVNGRALKLLSHKELIEAEDHFVQRYKQEQIASGQIDAGSNQIRARFC